MAEEAPVIVLTGGPCAGKTSILSYLQQELEEHGVHPIIVPEAARMLLKSGVHPSDIGNVAFQGALIRLQMAHEDAYRGLAHASSHERVVVLCDRGVMDSKAYLTNDDWDQVLAWNSWNIPHLRDQRYDAVLHLVTAADGAEDYYVSDSERMETAEEARALDAITQRAWVGCPHLRIIANSGTFAAKKREALNLVLHHLGMPVPLEIERKYKVELVAPMHLRERAERIEIEQAYLSEGSRIRKRGQGDHAIYIRSHKTHVSDGVREEREWQVSADEYYALLATVPPAEVIRKHRWCFVYAGQYFELDHFYERDLSYMLLEIELTDIAHAVVLPPWINVIADVTDDPGYSNYMLSRSAA